MSNDFYNVTGSPATSSAGASAVIRQEFAALQAGFDKLPTITGNANWIIVVDPTGTSLTAVSPATFTQVFGGLTTQSIGVSVQAFDTDLTAIAALTSAADKVLYSTGAGTWALAAFTSVARTLLAAANVSAQQAALSLTPGTNVVGFDVNGNVSLGGAGTSGNGLLQINGHMSSKAILETATVVANNATGTIAFDVLTQPVLYYTVNATANWTLNVRGDINNTLNSIMKTGQSCTIAFMAKQGATPFYLTSVQVDGQGFTPLWQGTAPVQGNASCTDAYTLTILKTANASFTVFATQAKFS